MNEDLQDSESRFYFLSRCFSSANPRLEAEHQVESDDPSLNLKFVMPQCVASVSSSVTWLCRD